MRISRSWAAALTLLILLPALALAAPTFPPLSGRVVDNAHLLSPPAQQKLTEELAALEQQTGHQVVVATLPDLQGYEIEDYGYQLLRTWAIGRKGQNDGVILIVVPSLKKVRIEVGYGLEPVMTDAVSSLIIQRKILPAFKAGRFDQGVVEGTEAIVHQIGLPADQAQAQAAQADRQSAPAPSGGGFPIPIVFVVVIVFWVLSGVLRMFGGRRRFGGSGLWWLLPFFLSGSSRGGGGWGGGGGGGGFSGGGGSGGGGGASGSW